MARRLARWIITAVLGSFLLFPHWAEAEVRITKPSPTRMEVVSDGPNRWQLPFYIALPSYEGVSGIVPAGADRTLFFLGNVLHLIDTRNGVVIGRWILPLTIKSVGVDGDRFLVRTSSAESGLAEQTTTIEAGSGQPPYWMNQSLLAHHMAVYRGSVFDEAAHFQAKYRTAPEVGIERRQPLAPEAAERLLVEVTDAARRNPFQPRFAVVEALLLKDAGRKEADAVFRQAMENPHSFFAEIFFIAASLGDVGEDEWSSIAFERGYALLWQQGIDPRMMYALFPRLMLLYLPYDLRLEIPADKRAELADRIYRLGPNEEWSPAAWNKLSEYFKQHGDLENATMWRERAEEAAKNSGFVWEPRFYLERLTRLLPALVAALILYYLVLQIRYAPQRQWLRQTGASRWWRLDHRLSVACWNRCERGVLLSLFAAIWLCTGLIGAVGQTVARIDAAPFFAGSMRSPQVRSFLEALPPSPERSFLIALSLQQAEEPDAAEKVYRTLPDSAASWNNLGVLQTVQGRNQEAMESFEHARRIDPEMTEAEFNSGRTVTGYWVDLHRKNLPGQKMLALPNHDMIYRAMRGPSPQLAAAALMGPFSGIPAARTLAAAYLQRYDDMRITAPLPARAIIAISTPALYLFLLFVLLLGWSAMRAPFAEVTQPPQRGHWILEFLFPGTGRIWRHIGGCVLAATIFCLLEIAFQRMSLSGFESYTRGLSFGLPPSPLEALGPKGLAEWPTDPNWMWTHGPLLLVSAIFVLNVAAMIRSRGGSGDSRGNGSGTAPHTETPGLSPSEISIHSIGTSPS